MNNSHDPLSVLHGDELPVQPDPAFAARLRARLESAVSLPNRTQGVDMSGTDTAIAELNEAGVAQARPRPAAPVRDGAIQPPGLAAPAHRWARPGRRPDPLRAAAAHTSRARGCPGSPPAAR